MLSYFVPVTRLCALLATATVLSAPVLARAQSGGFALLATSIDDDRTGRRPLPGALTARTSLAIDNLPLAQALDTLARHTGIGMAYADDIARAPRVSLRVEQRRVADVLLLLLRGSGWSAWTDASGQLVIRRDPARAFAPRTDAARVRLSGYIREAGSNELIRYASVSADADSLRTQSSADGFYFLALVPGTHRVRVRAIGFAPLDTSVEIGASKTRDFALTSQPVALEQVRIDGSTERSDVDPTSPDMSIARLDLKTIRQAPAALGEVDPIRSLTLLPGVSRSSDFSTAFSVRGGSSDQNLILLDEATIYNPAHVLGFLSVFNADAVADMTLHKGAIPARFGGRLSSVLDVRQREGDASQFRGAASIGLLSSRIALEGPLPAVPGSYLVTARRSYADLFLKAAPDTTLRENQAYFYDLNAKANVRLGTTGTLMASGYLGRDTFRASKDFSVDWGNVSGTLRWNQIFATRLFSKLSYTSGDYDYGLGFAILDAPIDWTSRIRSQELRVDESLHFSEASALEFGAEVASQNVHPGDLIPQDTAKADAVRIQPRHGLTSAAYVAHEFDIGQRFTLRYGARYSAFTRKGAATIYQYAGGKPVVYNTALARYEPGRLQDSTRYAPGATVASFGGLEPRISARLALSERASLKASYARTRQYLLLASRTNSPTPLDVWEPVGPWLKPQRADQVALGYAATTRSGGYEFSAETYYKRLYNVVDFVEGSDVVLNPRLETSFVQGVGRAYGLELFLRKQVGDVTGWVSYTLSRTQQRFAAAQGGGINDGRWFASPGDKTHDLSMIALRPVGKRWTLGSTFTLASGLPTTYPVSRYEVDGFVIAEYGARNGARLPVYHRLDLSMTRAGRRSELQLGAFNVYNRFNAQSMSFRQSTKDPLRTEAVQLSVFGVVPSISYTFRF